MILTAHEVASQPQTWFIGSAIAALRDGAGHGPTEVVVVAGRPVAQAAEWVTVLDYADETSVVRTPAKAERRGHDPDRPRHLTRSVLLDPAVS